MSSSLLRFSREKNDFFFVMSLLSVTSVVEFWGKWSTGTKLSRIVQSNLAIRTFLVALKLFLNAKSSLSLWSKWQIGHGKWFLNTNLFLIKHFLITKFDCTRSFDGTGFASNSAEISEGGGRCPHGSDDPVGRSLCWVWSSFPMRAWRFTRWARRARLPDILIFGPLWSQ